MAFQNTEPWLRKFKKRLPLSSAAKTDALNEQPGGHSSQGLRQDAPVYLNRKVKVFPDSQQNGKYEDIHIWNFNFKPA